jgi:hypothetical protein
MEQEWHSRGFDVVSVLQVSSPQTGMVPEMPLTQIASVPGKAYKI